VKIRVSRFDPDRDSAPRREEFDVPGVENGESVLGILQRIRESLDSTLAFRFGCRFKGCGLCTVEIDGRALPACMIRAKEGMEVGPLRSFAVVRDLVVDRRPLTEFFARQQLYVVPAEEGKLPASFEVPPAYGVLARCTECLACLAECPRFDPRDESFGGPLTFVKLAQLHCDPRDGRDRRAQAESLGVAACLSCESRCACPLGVPIYRTAIESLLNRTAASADRAPSGAGGGER
jgi:succinate dehydrogenase / fumarate reductase iron-sulfur subunit